MSDWSTRSLGHWGWCVLLSVGLSTFLSLGSVTAAPVDSVAPAPLPPIGDVAPDPNKQVEPKDILDMDVEQLARVSVTAPSMQVEVTTVSRTAQPIAQTPAAVYVVTNEMIKRSGARNVPEVLRTVPGVSVARVNGGSWAITIRGLNARFANKLLVQIDGVAIYSPTHSGVFWEREYVMLEDVERIEVIRGPGATVWGANAVNGVINIVTKAAKDSQGIYVGGGAGDQHHRFGSARVGGQAGNVHWRMYGFGVKDDPGFVRPPNRAEDEIKVHQGGFRMDWTPTCRDTVTIQGDFYDGKDGQIGWYTPPAIPSPMGCHETRFLTRWSRQVDENNDWSLQFYYYNPYALGSFLNNVATFDCDFQYHMKRDRHDIVWGAGYRNSDELWIWPGFITAHDTEQIKSYFVQDTITLVDDRLFATFGCKFDRNSVTKYEMQPTARVIWTPSEKTTVWGAISRAVRTPSLIERINSDPRAEDLLAYEIGMRQQPHKRFFWEVALYFNRYHDMLGSAAFFQYDNRGKTDTHGAELNATYEVNDHWRLTGSCSFYSEYTVFATGFTPGYPVSATPRNQFYLQSGWDLSENVTLDVMFRYVDSLMNGSVPSYFTGDIRLAWRPSKNLELSVVGQNLLCGPHPEFVAVSGTNPTEIEPGVYGMAAWTY
ncbi:MAG: TonB-dependent receptor [Pirellulales bacterium]|nr:TonB-dependent receptor [Pirellulales bacterium]